MGGAGAGAKDSAALVPALRTAGGADVSRGLSTGLGIVPSRAGAVTRLVEAGLGRGRARALVEVQPAASTAGGSVARKSSHAALAETARGSGECGRDQPLRRAGGGAAGHYAEP